MKLERLFTKDKSADKTVYDMFEYVKMDVSIINNTTKEIIFEQQDCEVVKGTSQISANILSSKYFKKVQVPKQTVVIKERGIPSFFCKSVPVKDTVFGGEVSIKQLVHRLAGFWAYNGIKQGYFDNDEALIFYDEIAYMLLNKMGSPNSPQFFNAGLEWAYGIKGGSQGFYYCDDDLNVIQSEDSNSHPQLHACFINGLKDNLVGEGGIYDLLRTEAIEFKYGSGAGSNFSCLRAKGEPLNGGGESSGLLSFLKLFDTGAGVVKSGGRTRRAARIVILDVDHPEIMDFIKLKCREEDKIGYLVAAYNILDRLTKAFFKEVKYSNTDVDREDVKLRYSKACRHYGVSPSYINKLYQLFEQGHTSYELPVMDFDFNGDATSTVTGQNANNSIRLDDAFIDAVKNDVEYQTKWRTSGTNELPSGKKAPTYKASDIFNEIAKSSWLCADPAIQFSDTINRWNPIKDTEIVASNPCSEYLFLSNTCCNLASLNLKKFLNGSFMLDKFSYACKLWHIVLDITVSSAQYPTKDFAVNSYKYRPTGLGFANLGGLLMSMGIPYDSDEGRSIASLIMSTLQLSCYEMSKELSDKLKPYPDWSRSCSTHKGCIERHIGHLGLMDGVSYKYAVTGLKERWNILLKGLNKNNGLRNSFVSVLAPTGTIGLYMDCDTTGIEPAFSLVVYKSLAGGGDMVLINNSVKDGLITLGYDKDSIERITEIATTFGKNLFDSTDLKKEHLKVFESAQSTGDQIISVSGHIDMMAHCQPFISGAISKTVNLPADITINEIKDIYLTAHNKGLKSISVYRSGSKFSEPISITKGEDKSYNSSISPVLRHHLPDTINAIRHKLNINGVKGWLHIGEYPDGSLGEIFLQIGEMGSTFDGFTQIFSIILSLICQHKTPDGSPVIALDMILNHLERVKFAPSTFKYRSILHVVAEKLRPYINIEDPVMLLSEDDQQKHNKLIASLKQQVNKGKKGYTGDLCTVCQSPEIVRNGNCFYCLACGYQNGCGG